MKFPRFICSALECDYESLYSISEITHNQKGRVCNEKAKSDATNCFYLGDCHTFNLMRRAPTVTHSSSIHCHSYATARREESQCSGCYLPGL